MTQTEMHDLDRTHGSATTVETVILTMIVTIHNPKDTTAEGAVADGPAALPTTAGTAGTPHAETVDNG